MSLVVHVLGHSLTSPTFDVLVLKAEDCIFSLGNANRGLQDVLPQRNEIFSGISARGPSYGLL